MMDTSKARGACRQCPPRAHLELSPGTSRRRVPAYAVPATDPHQRASGPRAARGGAGGLRRGRHHKAICISYPQLRGTRINRNRVLLRIDPDQTEEPAAHAAARDHGVWPHAPLLGQPAQLRQLLA
jgi:hypothetical protein